MVEIRDLDSDEDIFPSWPSSIQPFIIFWLFMFGMLTAASVAGIKNVFGAINPFILFPLAFLMFGFLALREAEDFPQLRTALGLSTPIPGFGLLSLAHGLGVGILIFQLWTGQLMKVQGSVVTASIVEPFYNPYTASASEFVFAGLASFAAVFMYHGFVATFEELYKLGMYKNASNWLHNRFGLSPTAAMGIALTAVFVLWTLWHYFSWPALTIYSIIMGLMYGVFFIAGYLVLALTGVIPVGRVENEELAMVLSGMVIYPNVGSHYSWNVLTTLTKKGYSYDPSTLLMVGIALTVLPLIFMYLTRRLYG